MARGRRFIIGGIIIVVDLSYLVYGSMREASSILRPLRN